jgi:hypothetical protein
LRNYMSTSSHYCLMQLLITVSSPVLNRAKQSSEESVLNTK